MMMLLNAAHAQQKHFIYIQSADKQPFAVVINNKVYSASDYGYVIVPKLTDGNYDLTISFPLNKFPDQHFKCVIDKKDEGYSLQNANNAWALQNLQTQTTLASNAPAANNTAATNNAFGDMLSQVVQDSGLAKKNVPAADNAMAKTAANIPVTVAASNVDSESNNSTTDTAAILSNIKDSVASVAVLQKLSEQKQDTGTNMVFVDNADTIKVFVPSAKPSSITNTTVADNNVDQTPATSNTDVTAQQADTNTNAASSTENNSTTKEDVINPFFKQNSTTQNNNTDAQTNNASTNVVQNTTAETSPNSAYKPYVPEVKTSTTPQTSNAVKSDCNNKLDDNDIDKLKRKMFVQRNDNDMVQVAIKYVNDRCITTEQVKTLGNLFSSDDGRYNLYDALYKKTYDYGNYPALETQILDPHYKRRFESMLR